MAQGDLAGIADDQVKADGQDDIDAGQDGQMQHVGGHLSPPGLSKCPGAGVSSTRMRMAKAMASLKPEEI